MTVPGPTRQALIGAGANLGDRRATLEAALAKLRAQPGVVSITRSAFYETAPVGLLEQPAFLNLAAGIETTLTPEGLMTALLGIEQEFGRVRTVRWGPRTLDLDLLAFEGETRAGDFLTLPHPRMLGRAFVTVPLRELLAREPFKSKWSELRAALGPGGVEQGVRRLES
ncbi:MAG: 2-amino-4-hydroxy-6-hydroxymethyldihydropteridine diphosphokinase [Verrucomicrobia bacterium]|nr:2-amino-4-hydroxy-6-hydroxymethyldihydropteridine diphosphokinase [Verrucomicrobiota bacterium]